MGTSIKILHVSTSAFGGAGRAAFRQHMALLESGANSWFLSADEGSGNKEICWQTTQLQPSVRQRFWKRMLQPPRSGKGIESSFQHLRSALHGEAVTLPFGNRILHQHPLVQQADIVNLHWMAGLLDYQSFFASMSKPIVWTLHDMQPFSGLFHYEDDAINNPAAAKLDHQIIGLKQKALLETKAPIRLAAPSAWLLQKATSSAPMRHLTGTVIPYSLNLSVFAPANKAEARRLLGLPAETPILLFVSKHLTVPRKAISTLLQAMMQLPTIWQATLVAIGHMDGLEIPAGIHCITPGMLQNDAALAMYYAAADVVVIPSKEDNLPNVLLEAVACGRPAIVTPAGGLREHIGPNNFLGVMAEDFTEKALASAISQCFQRMESFEPENIRSYASNNFAPVNQAKAYENLYRFMLHMPAINSDCFNDNN